MSETAAHLVDNVLPMQPIRQWVISFPFQIRLLLAVKPKIMARALDISHSVIAAYYRKKTGLTKTKAKTGAVTLIQRFGGSINLNVHFHMLFVDGSYELGSGGEPTHFLASKAPTIAELGQVLDKIITRVIKYLERQKIIVKDESEEEAQKFQFSLDEGDTFSQLQSSSVAYRFATGPSKGKKAIEIKTVPDRDHSAKTGLVAKTSGFSLHAGVAAKANERDKLERICRYIARPALAEGRLSLSKNAEVIYKLKTPWDDGTTAIKMTPMELIERLVALVPRPRVHLTRFHGVLAPHYKFRRMIVPQKTPPSMPQMDALGKGLDSDSTTQTQASKSRRLDWARLLKRVFGIDIHLCPKCAKPTLKIIAAIEDPKVIKKILNHLGLPSQPPKLTPARGPPELDQADLFTPPPQFWD